MALQLTPNPRANGNLSLAANMRARMASVLSIGWSYVTGKPDGLDNLRERLTANRTYYVRADGSNANDGLSDAAGGAFLTIQKALDVVAALDISIYDVTIQVVDGSYSGGMSIIGPWLGSGTVTVQGNSGTPGNVDVNTGATVSLVVQKGGRLTIKDLKIRAPIGSFILQAASGGAINFSNLEIGQCVSQQIRAQDNAAVTADGNYTISAGAANHWAATASAVIRCQAKTITITNTPAFSGAFANCSIGGAMIVNGNTFSGSATGSRYAASDNGTIYTAAAGTSYLPGNASGTGTNPGTSPYGLYN